MRPEFAPGGPGRTGGGCKGIAVQQSASLAKKRPSYWKPPNPQTDKPKPWNFLRFGLHHLAEAKVRHRCGKTAPVGPAAAQQHIARLEVACKWGVGGRGRGQRWGATGQPAGRSSSGGMCAWAACRTASPPPLPDSLCSRAAAACFRLGGLNPESQNQAKRHTHPVQPLMTPPWGLQRAGACRCRRQRRTASRPPGLAVHPTTRGLPAFVRVGPRPKPWLARRGAAAAAMQPPCRGRAEMQRDARPPA